MSTTSTRTDPRVLRTRQLIRDAFIDLLLEIGYEKITVNRLTERATINRVTFYLHYRDIPDMLEKIADDMINEIQETLTDTSNDTPTVELDEHILRKMHKLLEHIAENSKFYKALLASKRIPIFTDHFMKLMNKLITSRAEKLETSSNSRNIPIDIAMWYGSSAFIGTIICWLREDMPYTPLFLAKQLSILFRLQLPNSDLE